MLAGSLAHRSEEGILIASPGFSLIASPTMLRLVGLTAEPVLGLEFVEIIHLHVSRVSGLP